MLMIILGYDVCQVVHLIKVVQKLAGEYIHYIRCSSNNLLSLLGIIMNYLVVLAQSR